MRNNCLRNGLLVTVAVCLLCASALASQRQPSLATDEQRSVRALISQWVEAYKNFDAERIASLETADVEVMDRFGELHLPSNRHDSAKLWSVSKSCPNRACHRRW